MKIWKSIKDELWRLRWNERGGSKGGSAPQQRPPTPEELAQIEAVTKLYQQQAGYAEQLMPWQIPAGQYQIGLETGMGGLPAGALGGGKGGGVAPQPAGAPGVAPTGAYWRTEPSRPIGRTETDYVKYIQDAYGMNYSDAQKVAGIAQAGWPSSAVPGIQAAIPGAVATYGGQVGAAAAPTAAKPGVPGIVGAAGAVPSGAPDWYQDIAGRGGLMGIRAQLGAGLGRPGEPGTPYGFGGELEQALGGVEQRLQQRGLLRAGVLPALQAEVGGRIAERTEAQRRQEMMALLGQGA